MRLINGTNGRFTDTKFRGHRSEASHIMSCFQCTINIPTIFFPYIFSYFEYDILEFDASSQFGFVNADKNKTPNNDK